MAAIKTAQCPRGTHPPPSGIAHEIIEVLPRLSLGYRPGATAFQTKPFGWLRQSGQRSPAGFPWEAGESSDQRGDDHDRNSN
jgi:hypothetical protein